MSRRGFFLLLYAASGAAALVYEISWTRLLTLVMGQTVAAASTVLAAIMGGLALGSWIARRIEARWRAENKASRALGAYAALEVLVAIAAVLLPVLLRAAAPALAWAYADGAAPLQFGVVRALLAIGLVGIPATAMGATFPISVAWYAGAAADAGLVYAVNTAGAGVGALATGFWLLPAIGTRATTWIGVALNVAAAAGACWMATHPAATSEPQAPAGRASAAPRPRPARSQPLVPSAAAAAAAPRLAMTAGAVSGFCALADEVVWTRVAALVIGPTTYAFATTVASFIVGMAIGAAAGAGLARRAARPAAWLGWTLMGAGIAAVCAGWFAASVLPLTVAGQVAAADAAFAPIVTRQAIGTLVLLMPMTLCFGAAFPLALATASPPTAGVSGTAAHVYVANTIGAIGGSLAGGFVLLPRFGLSASLSLTACIGVIAAAAVWAADARAALPAARRWRLRAAAVAGAAALLTLLPAWNVQLLAGGAYKYASYLGLENLDNDLLAWRLLYLEDGAAATVSVRQLAGQRSLVIDGKVDASNMGDMLTQRLLGLLPVLLHTNAARVLVLGLGSGVTAASALAPGTTRAVDIVEISPEVVKASAFFAKENGGVLGAKGVTLIVGDGRSHLAFTTRRYDVIVSEPSNPWMAGIAALFTREFFETARRRLEPDGIICQWAHTYDISAGDLASIVHTFTSVFPASTMWLVGDGDLLLIGTNGPSIEAHLGGLSTQAGQRTIPLLRELGLSEQRTPFLLMSMFAGGPAETHEYGADAVVQTDDRLALEFSAPRAIYGRSSADAAATIRRLAARRPSMAAVRSAWSQATDEDWAAAGAMEMKADAYSTAYDRYLRALTVNSANAEALAGLSNAAAGAHRPNDARAWLEARAAAEPSNVNVRVELSRQLAASGDLERAASAAADAMRLAPDDERPAAQLASVFVDAHDGKRLAPFADALITRFPRLDKARFYRAHALFLNGDPRGAVDEVRLYLARHPDDVRAGNLLGVACATAGDRECARAAFAAALQSDPRDAESYVNLGVLQMQSGNPTAAAEQFAVAATLDRSSAAAREGLQEARAAIAGR